MTCRSTLALLAGALILLGAAPAMGASYKDERSTGGPQGAASDARCDISELVAERTKTSVEVTVKLRGDGTGTTMLYFNTAGGPTSDPEFFYAFWGAGTPLSKITGAINGGYPSASTPAGSVVASAPQGSNTAVVTVPLKALGSPSKVGVHVRTCGEGVVDVAPGAHHYGKPTPRTGGYSYLIADAAERVISGRVDLACTGSGKCTTAPVEGAEIKAVGGSPRRTYTTTTDDDGKYELGVKKGTYSVSSTADPLVVKTKPKTLDLTRKKKGTAEFEVCGMKSTRASVGTMAAASAVGSGRWKGSVDAAGKPVQTDCTNIVTLQWDAGKKHLDITWQSVPMCHGSYSTRYGGTVLDRARVVPSGQRGVGNELVVGADRVVFSYQIAAGVGGGSNHISGTLNANDGTVSAAFQKTMDDRWDCRYGMRGMKVTRKK